MYTKPMHLDRKLCQDIEVHPLASKEPDLYGVEIELEGRKVKTAKQAIQAFWEMHNDNSLRAFQPGSEAVEYVLRGPKTLDETTAALKVMFNHLNSPGVEVFPSYRTSIHVHLNCAAETFRTIYNLMTLSVIFDELFVSQNGEHRIGNNFCLRSRDAQGQIDSVVQSITHHGNIWDLQGNNRYSSVNFVSLTKYGTIEFRSLECTADLDRLMHWIATLTRLKVVARQFENPQDVISYFSRMSAKEFLFFTLGPCAHKYSKVDGYEKMLHSGMRLAQDIAYAAKWVAKDEAVEDKKQAEKKEAYEQAMQQLQAHAIQIGQNNPFVVQPAGAAANHLQNWVIAGGEPGAWGVN